MSKFRGIAILFCSLVLAAPALAVPPVKEGAGTGGDVTVTVQVLASAIKGDSKSFCKVRVVDTGKEVKFTAGDKIDVYVYEDDLFADDQLWHTQVTIAATDLVDGAYDKWFDCLIAVPEDGWDNPEMYAQAKVDKKECGFWCIDDTPSTKVVPITLVDDDAREADDTSADAKAAGLGKTADLVNRDDDWFAFEIASKSEIEFSALHTPAVGRLDVVLYDETAGQLALGSDATDATKVVATLETGKYKVRVNPRESNNYNFYDAYLLITTVTDCTDGQEQSEACGNCGSRKRTCTAGEWGAFGACSGEGVCQPAAEQSTPCGKCGQAKSTCSETCAWVAGACEGEGECEAGKQESQACTGGSQARTCSEKCTWGEWGTCEAEGCADGATKPCYTGPDGTKDVGVCHEGKSTCADGKWGGCVGEVVPTQEQCADGDDNDCDGKADGEDSECASAKTSLGSPCTSDSACSDGFKCLTSPDYAQFTGGYCSTADCTADADCKANGECVSSYGKKFCLLKCDAADGCRTGYVCGPFDAGKACVPKCGKDADCSDPARPYCNPTTGMCLKSLPAGVDTGTTPTDTATSTDNATSTDVVVTVDVAASEGVTTDAGGKSAVSSSSGCSASPTGSGLALALVLAFLAIAIRIRSRSVRA